MNAVRVQTLTFALLFAFSIEASAQTQISLPVTFDEAGVDYTLSDFGDALTALGADPEDSGNTVAITTKQAGAAGWAGTSIGTALGFSSAVPFTVTDTKVSVLVYSPAAGITVRLKVEDHTDNTLTAETEATTSVANAWQKLVFDFSIVATGTNPFNLSTNFDLMSIFFDFGADGTGAVFYWDDVQFDTGAQPDVTLTDLLVGGSTIDGFSAAVTTYSVELAEGTTAVPTVTATTTDPAATAAVTEATAIPGTTSVVVTGSDGVSRGAYSVAFSLPPPVFPPLSLPIDFEAGPYGFIDFDGGSATVIANPQVTDSNPSAMVAQIVRSVGAPWAGSKLQLESKLDFSVNNAFSMMVFSPRAEVDVLLKLEGSGTAAEVLSVTTKADEWELITWDFTDTPSGTFDQVVFMFDFMTVGDGTASSTFLFDDVTQYDNTGGLSRINLPVDFESTTVNWAMTDFGGASTVLGFDPDDAGNTVAVTTKTSGSADWAGTTIGTEFGFGTAVPFTASQTTLSVNVYSPAAGIPVRLKAEDHFDVTLTVETEATTSSANAWEVLVFDFSNVAPGTNPMNLATNFDKVSIFFDFGTPGTGDVYLWDWVSFGTRISTATEPSDIGLPQSARITGSYPSPFSQSTTILYAVDAPGQVDLRVYTVRGREVATLVAGPVQAGQHTAIWNADGAAAGVYFVKMHTAGSVSSAKVVLVR